MLNKNILRVYKRNLLLESSWTLGIKHEMRYTIYKAPFLSHQLLMVMNFVNLLLKVVLALAGVAQWIEC